MDDFYGVVADAAELTGLAEGNFTDSMQQTINDWIDAVINKDGFLENTGQIDYYDINRSDQSWLISKHMPIISITSIIDNQRSTNPITISTDSYVFDGDSGIIQLDSVNSSDLQNALDYFTKGAQSVKMTYNYGYASVPDIISTLATIAIAKWGEIDDKQSDADGLKSITIGDYKESFDVTFMSIKSKYDDKIKGLLAKAKAIYGRGV
ncbi:MAG: hypothetical protein ACXAC7_07955 [Candidatus Hodarchaeales archaeon]|jgi:hypothetical protein